MKTLASLLASLVLAVAPSISHSRALDSVGRIGTGWAVGQYGWMGFVAFNRDGTMIASDGATSPSDVSEHLSFWTFPGGRLVKQFPDQPFAISPDWRYYAGRHGVWSVESGKPILTVSGQDYPVYAFSADSRYITAAEPRGFQLVDLTSGRVVREVRGLRPWSLAMSPDGRTGASGHWNIVSLWNVASGARAGTLRGLRGYVESLAFSPNGRLLAAGTHTGVLQIWDVARRRRIASFDFDGGDVSAAAFSPDGRLVAVGVYGTGTFWVIDVAARKIIAHRKVSELGCGSVAFSPDGRSLITPSTGGLIKWPMDLGGSVRVFKVRSN